MVKTTIASAVGVAAAGSGAALGSRIEAAMSKATQDCFDAGITDPDKIREAKLAARETVKADARKEAEAKALKDAQEKADEAPDSAG